jgi:hypothetical protein
MAIPNTDASFTNIPEYNRLNDPPTYPPYNNSNSHREVPPEGFDRSIVRTPSPTPSEQEYLGRKTMLDQKAFLKKEYWKKPKNIRR